MEIVWGDLKCVSVMNDTLLLGPYSPIQFQLNFIKLGQTFHTMSG